MCYSVSEHSTWNFHFYYTCYQVTHWLRENGYHFACDSFKCILVHGNYCILIELPLKFISKGPINEPAFVQMKAWYQTGSKPLSEPMMAYTSLLTCTSVTQPPWVKMHRYKHLCTEICVLFLAATKQLYEWYFLSVCPSVRLSVCPSVCPSVRLSVCPSVRLSVCPSVRLSHLFDYVPIIVSSWNFQELSHWTRVRSMQKVKVRGQRSRSQRSRPKFSFPDCNSSLNSHMIIKLYI